MIKYNRKLKNKTRCLRTQMTDSERVLWKRVPPQGRSSQSKSRDRSPDVDGSQHTESEQTARDLQVILGAISRSPVRRGRGGGERSAHLQKWGGLSFQSGEPIVVPLPRMPVKTSATYGYL